MNYGGPRVFGLGVVGVLCVGISAAVKKEVGLGDGEEGLALWFQGNRDNWLFCAGGLCGGGGGSFALATLGLLRSRWRQNSGGGVESFPVVPGGILSAML